MKALPRIVSVGQLQRDTATVLEQVRASDRPFVVTMSDVAVAVLLGAEIYEDLVESAEQAEGEPVVSGSTDDPTTLDRIHGLLPSGENFTMADVERTVILERLQKLSGNRMRAADSLGIGLRTLQRKIKQYRRQGVAVLHSTYDDSV